MDRGIRAKVFLCGLPILLGCLAPQALRAEEPTQLESVTIPEVTRAPPPPAKPELRFEGSDSEGFRVTDVDPKGPFSQYEKGEVLQNVPVSRPLGESSDEEDSGEEGAPSTVLDHSPN